MATQEFTCIGNVTTSSSVTSMSVSIPAGTGSHLMLIYKLWTTGATVRLRFNNDSGSNYASTNLAYIWGNYTYANNQQNGILIAQPNTDDEYASSGTVYIPDTQTSGKCVSIVQDGGAGSGRWFQSSGTWFNTSARVTSVGLHTYSSSYTFENGSSIAVYALGES